MEFLNNLKARLPDYAKDIRLNLDAVISRSSLSPTHAAQVAKSYSAGITASWELDLFGKLQSESDAALEQYFASTDARKAAQLALVAEVADQYLTLLAADALVEVTLRTQKTAEASLRLTTLQFDNGVEEIFDVQALRGVRCPTFGGSPSDGDAVWLLPAQP